MPPLANELAEVLRKHPELGLSDEEIRFIALVMSGYACSPLPVRAATVPSFKAAAKMALDLMAARRKPEPKPDGGGGALPN